jgi:signal transduction histidine kinase
VVGRPVVLWEIIGPHQAVARASSGPDVGARPPGFDLDAALQQWSIPVPIGSRWVSAPGATPDAWVVAPVRSRPPAGPPGGRERRSRERLTLELAGLALGAIASALQSQAGGADSTPAMQAHQVASPLTAARAALQLSMESIGRWVDLAADRRLSLLDDLGQVLEDLDRTSELLRAMKESARKGALTTRADRGGRFDAVRVVRSCLTLERRLLRDRGIELEFVTSLESVYLKGDSNALFDLLVSLVRTAADFTTNQPAAVRVRLEQKGKELELVIRGGPALSDLTKVRSVTEEVFSGTVRVESPSEGTATTLTIALPLPPQREADRHPS